MGEQLTDEEMTECKRAFALFDRDGDGSISTGDLGSVMRTMGYSPTDTELLDILNEIDTEGYGIINFIDFLSIMAKKLKEYEGEESLRLAFRVFDKHDKGQVTVEDFRYMMANIKIPISEHELEEIIKEADKERTGFITYNEFISTLAAK